MKTLVQPILIAAGLALVATAAQANPSTPALGATYLSTMYGQPPIGGNNFVISSEVTQPGGVGTPFYYFYNVADSSSALTGRGISAFTVYLLSGIATFAENAPGIWGTGVQNVNNVNWTTSGTTGDSATSVTFSFESYFEPIWGYGNSQDAGQWNDYNAYSTATYGANGPTDTGIAVPNTPPPPPVPDGGLTVALLGVSLVGIQVLRRKLA